MTNQEQRPDGIAEPLSGAGVGSNNEPTTLKEFQDLKLAFSEQNHRLYVATERATTLKSENKRLREALKPFSDVAEKDIAASEPDNAAYIAPSWSNAKSYVLTNAHFRSARAAFKGDA